jgi:hypothetical protein
MLALAASGSAAPVAHPSSAAASSVALSTSAEALPTVLRGRNWLGLAIVTMRLRYETYKARLPLPS